jgi:hypothetical protein
MPLLKEILFNVRRAVYTFVASMSSKNNKKTAVSLPDNRNPFSSKNKIGTASEVQLL